MGRRRLGRSGCRLRRRIRWRGGLQFSSQPLDEPAPHSTRNGLCHRRLLPSRIVPRSPGLHRGEAKIGATRRRASMASAVFVVYTHSCHASLRYHIADAALVILLRAVRGARCPVWTLIGVAHDGKPNVRARWARAFAFRPHQDSQFFVALSFGAYVPPLGNSAAGRTPTSVGPGVYAHVIRHAADPIFSSTDTPLSFGIVIAVRAGGVC